MPDGSSFGRAKPTVIRTLDTSPKKNAFLISVGQPRFIESHDQDRQAQILIGLALIALSHGGASEPDCPAQSDASRLFSEYFLNLANLALDFTAHFFGGTTILHVRIARSSAGFLF